MTSQAEESGAGRGAAAHRGRVVVVLDHQVGQVRRDDGHVAGVDIRPDARRVLDALADEEVYVAARVAAGDAERLAAWLPGVTGVRPLPEGPDGIAELLAALPTTKGRVGDLCVAADRRVRAAAAAAGWHALPDLAMVPWVRDGHRPVLALVRSDPSVIDRLADVLPCGRHVGGVLAWTTETGLATAALAGADLQRLDLDQAREDAVWVRMGGVDRGPARDALARLRVLVSVEGAVLVAVGPDDELGTLPLHGTHGHYTHVTPAVQTRHRMPRPLDVELLRWPWDLPPNRLPDPPVLAPPSPCDGWSTTFVDDVARYAGVQPLDASGTIVSRNTLHADNDRAVEALLEDLRAMGYCPWVHEFSYAGRTVRNVLADLPGRGVWARPKILELLRQRLLDPAAWHGRDDLHESLSIVAPEGDAEGFTNAIDATSVDLEPLNRLLRDRVRLEAWWPWWLRQCLPAGFGARLVLVGCHLDSTASRGSGYDPRTMAAPGADDDGSGIAGTLAVARWLARYRGSLRHTVRFGFFNTEEEGLVGSAAYAADLAAYDAPVEAAVFMDMIGHNTDANLSFEVHAGFPDPAIRDASEPIAHRIAAWSTSLGQLPAPQVHRGTQAHGGTNRDLYDPAIWRSDHASFQSQGFPAVVVSEDFFTNPASEPSSDGNPDYHRASDTAVDASYGAAIACAVAHAVRDIAAHGL